MFGINFLAKTHFFWVICTSLAHLWRNTLRQCATEAPAKKLVSTNESGPIASGFNGACATSPQGSGERERPRAGACLSTQWLEIMSNLAPMLASTRLHWSSMETSTSVLTLSLLLRGLSLPQAGAQIKRSIIAPSKYY